MTKTIEFRDDLAAKVADKVFQDYLLYAPARNEAREYDRGRLDAAQELHRLVRKALTGQNPELVNEALK